MNCPKVMYERKFLMGEGNVTLEDLYIDGRINSNGS
jgi:hypothetical protein